MTTEEERIKIIVDLVGEKAWQELERDAQRFAKTTQQVTQQSKTLGRETQALTKNTRALGNRMQNSAFQLGDFLVQVEAGVPATRAFGQQASQLLGAFGPWGAVLGVAAATVPILVTALRDGEEAMKDFDSITNTMAGSISRLTGELGRESGLANDLNGLAEAFNNASMAMRESLLVSLRADLLQARQEVSDMARSIGREIAEGVEGGMLDWAATNATSASILNAFLPGGFDPDAFEANRELEQAAELLGTTTEGASAFLRVLDEINSGRILPEDAPSQLDAVIVRFGLASDQIRGLREELQQYRDAAAREESLTQFLSGGTADRPVLPQGESSGVEPGFSTEGNLPIPADGPDEYDQYLRERMEDQRRAFAEWAASMEELRPLSDEVFGSFTNSFDQMVTGIARGTQDIKESFGNMAKALIADLVRLAAYRGILALLGGPGTAVGGAFAQQTGQLQPVQAFARGGVVNAPTLFPMSRGVGMMGEDGAEGIFPLGRLPNGDLGVQGAPMNVTINNNAAGVEVSTSQGEDGLSIDIVRVATAAVASEIARGGNPISAALAGSYGLTRAGS